MDFFHLIKQNNFIRIFHLIKLWNLCVILWNILDNIWKNDILVLRTSHHERKESKWKLSLLTPTMTTVIVALSPPSATLPTLKSSRKFLIRIPSTCAKGNIASFTLAFSWMQRSWFQRARQKNGRTEGLAEGIPLALFC